jgi:PPM family protein phosphatase
MALRFEERSATWRGGREVNEDARAWAKGKDGRAFWMVADGLGGHGGGEIASRMAVEAAKAHMKQHFGLEPSSLDGALAAAQSAIVARKEEEPGLSRMHSTMVLLVTDGSMARWAHLGDSRLYHFRNGRIRAETEDHSVPQMLFRAGEITKEEIRTHEDRNRLLRSLGSDGTWKPSILAEPVELKAGDAFLLCTDGFWELVLENEMEADLAATDTAEKWLTRMLRRLAARAGEGHDNYTAIAVRVVQ